MKIWIIFLSVVVLASCGSTGPKPDVVASVREVQVPVPVACVPADAPAAPAAVLTSSELQAMRDRSARRLALEDFYLTWAPWISMAVPLIENCRAKP
jgi:hypothetical protein